MKYLLDTHVLLWFRARPEELGPETLRLLQGPETHCALSVVSALELAQLTHKNRIALPTPVEVWFEEAAKMFQSMPTGISIRIACEAYKLPGDFHPDPADRLLVATARIQQHTLITADQRILDYPAVTTINARM